MKKKIFFNRLIPIIVLVMVTFSCNKTDEKDEANKNYVEFTTDLPIGTEVHIDISCDKKIDKKNVWIDLNNNGAREDYYENLLDVDRGYKKRKYVLGNQTIRIYGNFNILHVKDLKITKLTTHSNKLEILTCPINELTHLDVSKSPRLKKLDCSYNKLTHLDISKNHKIKDVSCFYNELKTLDFSNNKDLEELGCSHNELIKLDISNNKKLEILGCSENKLTYLDTSNNTNLKLLSCEENRLTTLDVSNNIRLESFVYSYRNPITCIKVNIQQLGSKSWIDPEICKTSCE